MVKLFDMVYYQPPLTDPVHHGFSNQIPTGALLLVSDQPMVPEGVKTAVSDKKVTQKFADLHLQIGIDSLMEIIHVGLTVKHLKF